MREPVDLSLKIILLCFLGFSMASIAQELDLRSDTSSQPTESEVENLYDQLDQQVESQYSETTRSATRGSRENEVKVESLSDLARLQAFEDIAVIQKRYLPKTQRFEISALGFTNINNPFFNNLGFGAKAAYHFNENFAIEGIGNWFGVAARQVVKDLEEKARVSAANSVTARSFLGAAVKWSPIYGKISLLNASIIPFDLSFSAGGGLTKTDESNGEPTIHLGTSQNFAINKTWSFRWDVTWNLYQANARNSAGDKVKIAQNDLFIGLGVSAFIPEATYR